MKTLMIAILAALVTTAFGTRIQSTDRSAKTGARDGDAAAGFRTTKN